MIAIDLSKQQALDADLKTIQQINFTANLDRAGKARIFFIFVEAKQIVLEISQKTLKVLYSVSLNNLMLINIKWLHIMI